MCASVFLDSSAQLALLLVNLLFFALPLRAKREERWQNRKEEEARDGRVMFPLLLCSFERRRVKKKSRGSCNRPRYVSAQMRRIRVLLFWVGPEETTWRSTRVFNVQFSYIMNLLASPCSESKSPAGKIKINCLFVTSLILRSDTRADWYTDERWLDEWWFQRYCQKKKPSDWLDTCLFRAPRTPESRSLPVKNRIREVLCVKSVSQSAEEETALL